MNQEIERKFLVKGEFKHLAYNVSHIKQVYLTADPNRSVRIRITDKSSYLTIKGKSNQSGTTRFEFETEISLKDAEDLMLLGINHAIEKNRYLVSVGKHVFEVDEFMNTNKGLILAEIELSSDNEDFTEPDWLGIEVTGIKKYYNLQLSQMPFLQWDENQN